MKNHFKSKTLETRHKKQKHLVALPKDLLLHQQFLGTSYYKLCATKDFDHTKRSTNKLISKTSH